MDSHSAAASRSETIATTLRDEILSGQYRAGERLPSERDLSERFGVSRGVVREAVKQLQQLGIIDVQQGGARIVPVSECTLDVLGPLLELNEIPDPALIDQVLHMFGVLMREAAAAAIERATDEEIETAEGIIDDILAASGEPVRQFDCFRELGTFYIDVADKLVLKLIINGLETSFMARMPMHRLHPALDPKLLQPILEGIRNALRQRNSEELTKAMYSLNRLFRDSASGVLQEARSETIRKQA